MLTTYVRGNIRRGGRILWAGLSALIFLCPGGCNWVPDALGMHNRHLLQTQDVVALPGETVSMRVRLESGSFLRDDGDRAIRFVLEKHIHAVAVTDRDGVAEAQFVPPSPGDYRFRIEVADAVPGDAWPEAHLLVSCRRADASMVIVDLDGTLMAADFKRVLMGDPEPLPLARQVLTRLAQDRTIVYLTHRPEYFGPKSKGWLARHRFPRGPVLLSERSIFAEANQPYKTQKLQDLRSRFTGMIVGIGDKITDALAYRENGLRTVLIYPIREPGNADDLREQAMNLNELPEDVHVVHDWAETQAILLEAKRYPPRRMAEELLQHANRLRHD